ncbi:MAG: hypothetical protein RL514_3623 [Verrucomicrobiota bacterium]|jgi:hypothetical protein
MARRKRNSPSIAGAQMRAASLKSIDAALDLGNGLTLAAYQAATDAADAHLTTYNTKLSELDGLLNNLEADEAGLDELSTRMLAGVGVKYGKDSDEYEQAGGTRTSDRKKSKRGQTPTPPPTP